MDRSLPSQVKQLEIGMVDSLSDRYIHMPPLAVHEALSNDITNTYHRLISSALRFQSHNDGCVVDTVVTLCQYLSSISVPILTYLTYSLFLLRGKYHFLIYSNLTLEVDKASIFSQV